MSASHTERIFSELDRVRIERLAARFPTPDGLPHAVLEGFDEGDFLMPSDIPSDVVTVNSRLLVRDQDGAEREITICYPSEADAPKGFISVLSPVGGHLLGHRVGATVSWVDASGTPATLHIEALLFQPEASGELAL
ncbi:MULTISPECIES: GreA/GreB family elongation factor [unclassified Bordetella]|uniref:GreA/GreB family elongation factor n=1 Tax=unclassified Bordetella TaxID=2630031 RepID=UPI001323F895|nr:MULTISPECIES: GreA/GreB family elongation factor [unclassified Bordetella]MVW73411.1 transcription elongation factor GreAB [Bordetella sp. 15P40C-2]MVW80312.1 transcription elongation factor GreAB [Bordetella sp. 02P26C-1]